MVMVVLVVVVAALLFFSGGGAGAGEGLGALELGLEDAGAGGYGYRVPGEGGGGVAEAEGGLGCWGGEFGGGRLRWWDWRSRSGEFGLFGSQPRRVPLRSGRGPSVGDGTPCAARVAGLGGVSREDALVVVAIVSSVVQVREPHLLRPAGGSRGHGPRWRVDVSERRTPAAG